MAKIDFYKLFAIGIQSYVFFLLLLNNLVNKLIRPISNVQYKFGSRNNKVICLVALVEIERIGIQSLKLKFLVLLNNLVNNWSQFPMINTQMWKQKFKKKSFQVIPFQKSVLFNIVQNIKYFNITLCHHSNQAVWCDMMIYNDDIAMQHS